jgi:putative addiction module component (TIGR02574 family)
MNEIRTSDILKLSIPERIILVEEIWDTIVSEYDNDLEITNMEKKLIDQRLDSYQKNPEKISEWKDVYNRIVKSNEL